MNILDEKYEVEINRILQNIDNTLQEIYSHFDNIQNSINLASTKLDNIKTDINKKFNVFYKKISGNIEIIENI